MFIMLKSTPCPQCGKERILMYGTQQLNECESDPYAGKKCSDCDSKEILDKCNGDIHKAIAEMVKRELAFLQGVTLCK